MKIFMLLIISSLLFLTQTITFAEISLPRVFGNNMVLQREMPAPIWGWAAPNETLTITVIKQDIESEINTYTVKADEKGNWRTTLEATPAGGPYKFEISGSDTVEFTDILFGEVWVCSGQSNMAWSVNQSKDSQAEIAAANYPMIRLFHIPNEISGLPSPDVNAQWRPTTPDNIRHFSAVAYAFGRHLNKELNVPIGLINASWGGSRIEPWTPPEGFAAVKALASISEELQDIDKNIRTQLPEKLQELETWIAETRRALEDTDTIYEMPEIDHPLKNGGRPTAMYNNMIYPIVPYAIRGALWYQGESNMREGMMYHEKMKALIQGWREVWKQDDFPFYFVQLAPWGGYDRTYPHFFLNACVVVFIGLQCCHVSSSAVRKFISLKQVLSVNKSNASCVHTSRIIRLMTLITE